MRKCGLKSTQIVKNYIVCRPHAFQTSTGFQAPCRSAAPHALRPTPTQSQIPIQNGLTSAETSAGDKAEAGQGTQLGQGTRTVIPLQAVITGGVTIGMPLGMHASRLRSDGDGADVAVGPCIQARLKAGSCGADPRGTGAG